VQGPLARSAEDLELALSVLAGPDVGEDVAWTVALPPTRRERLADFRVAVLPPIPWHPVDEQIWAAQQDVVARLGKLGCVVKEAQPDGLDNHREYHAFYRTLLAAVVGARMDAETRKQRVAMFRAVGDDLSVAHARGFEGSAADFMLWHGRREQHRAAWRAFFRDWDILLSPAINVLAYPHIERAWPVDDSDTTITLPVNGQPQPYLHSLCYPALSNVPGHPATAFPVGVSREGLPIGLQAIGPYLEDLTPIRFTALLAREIGGFRKPAGYDES
jgi:amidase